MHLKAQIRSLRRSLGRRPWVFARLAELEAMEGRSRQALRLLRQGIKRYPAYSSGHQVLGELLLSMGQVDDARRELLLASSCCVSGHASFELLVECMASASRDTVNGLLEEAWSRDRLNPRLRDRMRSAGLIHEPEFREILAPTEGERRARDEEIATLIRRLIDVHESPEAPQPAPGKALPGDTREPSPTRPPTPDPDPQDPRRTVDAGGGPVEGGPVEDIAPPEAPPVPQPPAVPAAPDHGELFVTRTAQGTPQPIRSRALARVYEEQGYLELALGVVCDLLEPGNVEGDHESLVQWRQSLEARLAERNS